MKKLLILTLVFYGCTVMPPLQQRKLISVFHLIETAKYEEAKGLIEEMVNDPKTSQGARTWYARGLLCQSAYQTGIQKNDKKLTELYPDQLFVAWESYEKALSLDKVGRTERQILPGMIYLANEFQRVGEKHYREKRFPEALRAYEQALRITLSPVMSVRVDTGLIHNAGLAAYEARDWEKAVRYLGRLHDQRHSSNVTHLLAEVHLFSGDTAAARKVLTQGISRYDNTENLVLMFAGLLYQAGDAVGAVTLLGQAMDRDTISWLIPYNKGLVLQKSGRYVPAVEAYKMAFIRAGDKPEISLNLATCYYNIGVEIEDLARTLTSSKAVQDEKAKSLEAYQESIYWVNKAWEQQPADPAVKLKLDQLARSLRIPVKPGGSPFPGE
jgi:tetratricopeptide (TPR) repeat protein